MIAMKILLINVRNLEALEAFLKEKGVKIVKGPHMVLEDQSEFEKWEIVKNDATVGEAYIHFIDHHFGAIIKLKENVSDREFIIALIESEDNKWAVAVEPVLIIIDDEELSGSLLEYNDEFKNEEAKSAYNYYIEHDYRKIVSDLIVKILLKIIASGDEGPINRT